MGISGIGQNYYHNNVATARNTKNVNSTGKNDGFAGKVTGKSLTEAMTMLIPQAWNGNELMDEKEKAYYNYHAAIMEPWDGPAAIAFTNGIQLGAMLDRNGLRPSRYTITKDGFLILASETGVLETKPANVEYSGRLEPGKICIWLILKEQTANC